MDSCEIPRWQVLKATLNNYTYEEFVKKMTEDPLAVCLDARTPEEFAQGHLTNAININYLSHELADELEQLDKNKRFYVYCRTSRRSLRICVLLRNLGFEHVYHLEDGMKDYLEG